MRNEAGAALICTRAAGAAGQGPEIHAEGVGPGVGSGQGLQHSANFRGRHSGVQLETERDEGGWQLCCRHGRGGWLHC